MKLQAVGLHQNLVLGSFQLLWWFFFHPSAWHRYIARIEPPLEPNFRLTDLRRSHFQNPVVRQLGVQLYLILPLSVGICVALGLWAFKVSVANLIFGTAVGVAAGGMGCAMGSLLVGVAPGVASSAVSGAIAGWVLGWVGAADLSSAITPAATGAAIAQGAIYQFVSIAANVPNLAASLVVSFNPQPNYSRWRLLLGAVLGIFFSTSILQVISKLVESLISPDGSGLDLGTALQLGALLSLGFGVCVSWRSGRWWRDIPLSLVAGCSFSLAIALSFNSGNSAARGAAIGAGNAAMLTILFALPYISIERVAGAWVGAIAGMLCSGGVYVIFASTIGQLPLHLALMVTGLCMLLGLTFTQWRSFLLYPSQILWNWAIYQIDRQLAERSLLKANAAFWDEFQRSPLWGLDRHLILTAERYPEEGERAIAELTATPQRWAARAARIELDARYLERLPDIKAIAKSHQKLPASIREGAVDLLFRSFSRISEDIDAALNQNSAYNQRLSLLAAGDRLDGLLRELTRTQDRHGARFCPIVRRWHQIVVESAAELAIAVEERQEIDSPYVLGVPLTAQQEIFVGRSDIARQIERLLCSSEHHPLLLYGQRRMGKTSLLNNLGRLLPSQIVPLFVDLQGAASRASDPAGFLYNLARGAISSAQRYRNLTLPALSREALASDPFTAFDEWLDLVEGELGECTALLSLDEFEVLAQAIERGRLVESDILGTLRNIMQHRDRFKILLAGTHTLEEFHQWSSYLVNIRVAKIGYLSESETRQLIEHPVPYFTLKYELAAVERVIKLTRGHPFLVQLLCAEIVALKNAQTISTRWLATLNDVESAIVPALSSGSFFFADIERNSVSDDGLKLLRYLAVGDRFSDFRLKELNLSDIDGTITALLQRDLIERQDQKYCFQIELIRRWFATSVDG